MFNKIIKIVFSIVLLYGNLEAQTYFFPQPTGVFSVGKKDFEWVDIHRLEKYGTGVDFRTLVASLWYPAEVDKCVSCSLNYDHDAQAYCRQKLAMIGFDYDEQQKIVSSIKINAQQDALFSMIHQSFPLIILSPGFGIPGGLYSGIAQELASHGYIVATLSHPYFAFQVTQNDGSVITQNQAPYDSQKKWAKSQEILKCDVQFVLDMITGLNERDDFFQGKIDLNRVGLMGHSFGGSTTTHLLQGDERFAAGVNMDGPIFNNQITGVNSKPLMHLLGQEMWDLLVSPDRYFFGSKLGLSKELIDIIFDGYLYFLPKLHHESSAQSYLILLDGVNHNAFCDLSFLKTIPAVVSSGQDFLTGSLTGAETMGLTHTLLLQFFDKYLKNRSYDLSEKFFHTPGITVYSKTEIIHN